VDKSQILPTQPLQNRHGSKHEKDSMSISDGPPVDLTRMWK